MQLNGKVFIVLIICLALVTLVAEPKQNGFDCSDQSIRGPFIALQIPLPTLLTICILIPILSVIIAENVIKSWRETPVNTMIKKNVRAFMFGMIINFVAVMSAKNIFGRLRPHTIQFCNANHYCPEGSDNKYIESFDCRNDNFPYRMQRNVRHSFYSGHASLSVYSAVFLILYLKSKIRPKSDTIRHLLVVSYLLIAVVSTYPGFTQWKNYWHFASDVLTGYVIGLFSGIVVFKLFASDSKEAIKPKNSNYKPLNELLTTTFLCKH